MVKVIWTQTAQRVFDGIIEYLLEHGHSNSVAENFFLDAYSQIIKIGKHPTRGRKVPNTKNMRFVNFGKHYQIFYRMNGRTLHVSNFFDTRQDPAKRPY